MGAVVSWSSLTHNLTYSLVATVSTSLSARILLLISHCTIMTSCWSDINKDKSTQLLGALSVRELSRVVEAVRILQYYGLAASLSSLCLHLVATLSTVSLILVVHHSILATSSILLTAPLDTTDPAHLLPGLSSISALLRLLSLRLVTSLGLVCLGNISSLLQAKKKAAPASARVANTVQSVVVNDF